MNPTPETNIINPVWDTILLVNSPCYGVIIFDLSSSGGVFDGCVIVKTPPKKEGKGENVGFPKGKCEKNKETKRRENIFEGSAREVYEETGILFSQLQFADGIYCSEMSDKGNISITYLVAKYVGDPSKHIFTYDTKELAFSGFLKFDEAVKGMWKVRQNILSDAYSKICHPETTFTDGILLLNKYKNVDPTTRGQHPQRIEPQIESQIEKSSSQPQQTLRRSIPFKQVDKTPSVFKSSVQAKDNVQISKSMSYILRHGAIKLGLDMDEKGRVLLSDLLKVPQMRGITESDIRQVVDTNDKKRFELELVNNDLMIRAVQGHSKEFETIINDEESLTKITVPLEKCIHGTYKNVLRIIQTDGLRSMSRTHIHFTTGEPGNKEVISGMRSSAEVLIYIDMALAMADGIDFFISNNGVVLTKGLNGVLAPKYFRNVVVY